MQQVSDDVLAEKVYSSKRTRAGYLGAVTRVRGKIETLLNDPTNAETVRTLSQQYDNSWKTFVESHNYYMSIIGSDSQEFYHTLQQFDQLHLEKIAFVQKISGYLLDAATYFNEIIMDNSHLRREHTSPYAESVESYRSNSSRGSKHSSSSVVLEKRAQAVRANVALRLAEQEQWRRLEGEIKLLEIEKKHRELLRQQKMEKEEIERTQRLETLRQQSERELAEARQKAALMDLEAELEEQMEEHGEIDMSLVTQDQEDIPTGVDQFTGDIPRPLLYEDFLFEDEPHPTMRNNSLNPDLSAKPLYSTPVITASSPWTQWTGNSSASLLRNINPFATLAPMNATSICRPTNISDKAPMPIDNQQSVYHPRLDDLYPHTNSACYRDRLSIPTFNYTPTGVPPVRWTSASNVADQSLSSNDGKLPFSEVEHRTPLLGNKPTCSPMEPPPRRTSVSNSSQDGVLTMVASAMQSISSVQQKLASNQSLPAIKLDKFSGSPEHFPLFKQRFERRIMSRQDFDDGEKMLRLLQFLDGEAKEAVASLEAVDGGIHEALKILQKRYGRTCVIVSSIVDGLVKGPVIPNGDKTALRKFADKTARALATLKSLNCLHEINQGNLVEMAGRLPKHLQQRFAGLANKLEEKDQRFPTLSDFSIFVDKWANIANHPMNASKGKAQESDLLKGNKGKKEDLLPRYTMATGVKDDQNSSSKRGPQEAPCPCCSQAHPLHRCNVFKEKTHAQRNEFVKVKGLCYNCLKNNPVLQSGITVKHIAKCCPSKFKCRIEGCGASHHTLLHIPNQQKKESNQDSAQKDGSDLQAGSVNTALLQDSDSVLLQVVPLRVFGKRGKVVTTYAMLDSGSEITLVDPSLASTLDLDGQPDELVVSTVSNDNDIQHGYRVNLSVESLIDNEPQRLELRSAWCGRDLKIPLRHQLMRSNKSRWSHLQDVPFPDVQQKKISIIIGTNVPEAFIPLDVRHNGPQAPVAIRSCLGFSILGRIGDGSESQRSAVHNICAATDDFTLNKQVELFWKLESFGNASDNSKPKSLEDKRAEKVIEGTIGKIDGHYQMGLLWKHGDPRLPDNRSVAEIRLRHLRRRLERDQELKKKYLAIIDDYVEKGYACKLTPEETKVRSNKTWYLPHHPVLNPHKPGKVRAVFDAASTFAGTSLNDKLLQGPDLINNLVGILVRFRQDPVALIADIEAMFHQVRVTPEDCDALRFLWSDGDLNKPPEEYKMLVHIFGAKSSPCCANKALKQTADDNETKYGKSVADVVRRNFYVDDLLKSTVTVEQAIDLALKLIALLQEGGFRLTKFLSNRREVLQAIPAKERASPTLDLDLDQLPINRTLGLCWDAETDEFYFTSISTNKPATKRGILSVVSSLFDPLGFLAPYVLPIKALLQELWQRKLGWDDEIQDQQLRVWQRWLKSLSQLSEVRISRCYFNTDMARTSMIELHLFSDASEIAYAASAYLRIVDDDGVISCTFIMGKCRNCPIKRPTIPRLELMASVLAVRLSNLIRAELDWNIDYITFWTDSTTVLQYIRNENRRFQRFVATRLEEIHEHTTPEQWRHVPGAVNPADDGTRGLPIEAFRPKCRWWSGPAFLSQTVDQWPCARVSEVPEDDEEVLKPRVSQSVLAVVVGSNLGQLLNDVSSWSKLQRCVSWLARFVRHLRSKEETRRASFPKEISLAEMKEASTSIVRMVQSQHFQDEFLALQSGKKIKADSRLMTLSPILLNGVICVGGRLRHAPLTSENINPMIVPYQHHIATLIITYYHQVLGHAGREHVLSVVRQYYWIINARVLTRQILRRCITCRKRNEAPMKQMMGDLPKARLTPYEPPFTYTGLDFFGPFYVKRGRGTEKVYGCIFVCFTTRAIHIEDVGSLEADDFIQALRRFICTRGAAKEIWSDNGTNFVGGEKEIRLAIQGWNQKAIIEALHERGVEWHSQPLKKWHFQPPTASHMSGVWERLIRSVRKTMKAIIGHPHAFVKRETLRTVFAEAAGILNSRPLCPSSEDPNDCEPITPSHFLQQRQGLAVPPGLFQDTEIHSRKQWRRGQVLANHFWARWIREYLPLLQERKKWMTKKPNLRINDLVLLVDTTQPRGHWHLGRVTKVFFGADGLVRTAEVKTKTSTLVRPISKLCLLEEAL